MNPSASRHPISVRALRSALALLVALVWIVAGCAGGDDVDSTPSGTAAATYDTTLVVAKANRAEAESSASGPYWFYIRSGTGGFYDYDRRTTVYSQILACSQRVTTPGIFGKPDAVGPFSTYQAAQRARQSDVNLAIRGGRKTAQETAICNTKWQ